MSLLNQVINFKNSLFPPINKRKILELAEQGSVANHLQNIEPKFPGKHTVLEVADDHLCHLDHNVGIRLDVEGLAVLDEQQSNIYHEQLATK